MLMAARRRVAALRHPRPAARLARTLWIVWAVIVWNVVFDHVIVVAGRNYIAAADRAAFATPGSSAGTRAQHYENMDAWMRPAVTRGLWIATASAGVIAASGLLLVRAAERAARPQVTPCA
jgi:hypothetical protein